MTKEVNAMWDYLDIETPREMQGRSFRECLEGRCEEHRDAIFAELGTLETPPPIMSETDFASYRKRRQEKDGVFWFTDYTVKGRMAMIRADGWKYCYYAGDREELYNLSNDPLEMTNLAGQDAHAERKNTLKNRLLEWLLSKPQNSFGRC